MKKLIHVIFVFCILFICNETKAAKIIGSEISWNSLGNDTFEITVNAYISCTSGGAAFSPVALVITSDSCSNLNYINVGNYYGWTMEDITPLCKTASRICVISGGSGIGNTQVPEGIEKHIFKYKIFLGGINANCCWYKIHWEYCCRPNYLSTGYDSTNQVTESWLNRCAGKNINSPQMRNSPFMLRFAGQDVYYNPDAMDPDGDSLTYNLESPSGGNYTSPWKFDYPLTCLGGNNPNPDGSPATGFNLKPLTGELLFRPMQVQASVLKVNVTEWRRDSVGIYRVIGKTSRDMEIIIVQTSNNKQPSVSGPYNYDACVGQQICIPISTNDQDYSDTTRIYWNKGIPNGQWADDNGSVKHATGTFCWTPTSGDERVLPYTFIVNATDDHCPLFGSTSRIISINVRPIPKDTRSFTKITCNLIEFNAVPASSQFNAATYQWFTPVPVGSGPSTIVYSNASVCQFQFIQGGKYSIKSIISLNGCSNTYFDTLVVDSNPGLHVNIVGDTILCPGATSQLVADSALSYQWYADGILISGATARTYTATKAGKYELRRNSTGCYFQSNLVNIYETVKPVITKNKPLCAGDIVRYSVTGKPGATYQWYRSGALMNGELYNSLIVLQDGNYYCNIIQSGCNVNSITDTVVFLPLPAKPTITMNANTLISSSGFSYQWYYDTLIIAGATNISYNAPKSGMYSVKVTGANGCSIFSNRVSYLVGIHDNSFASKIKISPNPFHHIIKISASETEMPLFVSLYDLQGRLILSESLTQNVIDLGTKELSIGLYFLEIRSGEDKMTVKVIKE